MSGPYIRSENDGRQNFRSSSIVTLVTELPQLILIRLYIYMILMVH